MNRTLHVAWPWVFALILATAPRCRAYRTGEFVAVQRPVEFENWRIDVNAFVDAGNPSPANHFYRISALPWTLLGARPALTRERKVWI